MGCGESDNIATELRRLSNIPLDNRERQGSYLRAFLGDGFAPDEMGPSELAFFARNVQGVVGDLYSQHEQDGYTPSPYEILTAFAEDAADLEERYRELKGDFRKVHGQAESAGARASLGLASADFAVILGAAGFAYAWGEKTRTAENLENSRKTLQRTEAERSEETGKHEKEIEILKAAKEQLDADLKKYKGGLTAEEWRTRQGENLRQLEITEELRTTLEDAARERDRRANRTPEEYVADLAGAEKKGDTAGYARARAESEPLETKLRADELMARHLFEEQSYNTFALRKFLSELQLALSSDQRRLVSRCLDAIEYRNRVLGGIVTIEGKPPVRGKVFDRGVYLVVRTENGDVEVPKADVTGIESVHLTFQEALAALDPAPGSRPPEEELVPTPATQPAAEPPASQPASAPASGPASAPAESQPAPASQPAETPPASQPTPEVPAAQPVSDQGGTSAPGSATPTTQPAAEPPTTQPAGGG